MMNYDYMEAMMDDIRTWIESEVNLSDWAGDRDGLEEHLNEELWAEDSVTGNGSGSYTCNRYEAIEYISDNWDLLIDVLDEFGCDAEEFIRNPEAADVSIRCYLLGQAISEVLDEYEEEINELAEEQDDEEETEVA